MPDAASEDAPTESRYGPVTVLFGDRGGRYPDGNSVLVEGERETVLIDPALGVVDRAGELPRIDRVIHSHCHEDHFAGSYLFPDVPWHVHEADKPGFASLDDMMNIYGYGSAIEAGFRPIIADRFNYRARPDAAPFAEGDAFDLGGVTVTVRHAPGHTRGHSCLSIEWDHAGSRRHLLYLGDIDLSSFGPYYGDAWSNLDDFDRSLARVRAIEADWYATFHHIGVLDDRTAYLERLDRFAGKIAEREARLLDFLAEPRSLEEVVAHRFVYRPQDDVPFADGVERRSMSQHIERLLADGRLKEEEGGRYVAP